MSVAACPGCATGTAEFAAPEVQEAQYELLLPGIHCAGCISNAERVLNAQPDIRAARVNLTRRRALIDAAPGAMPTAWIDVLAEAGIEAHEATPGGTPVQTQSLALHLGVAGFAMMNVMLLSVAVWSGAADVTRDFLHWISAMIALPATAFAAQPFFRNALAALSRGRLAMDVPISLAIVLALGMSLYETIHGGAHAWYDAALSLTFFLLAGRVLDQRMRRAVRSAAADLSALEPRRAMVVRNGARLSTPVEEIALGDTLWLAAGARLPVDAVLAAREVRVDRSALTGEADPVALKEGDPLIAGDVVLTGPVEVRATAVGEDTTLRRMARLVSVAEMARGRFSGLAERAAGIYTPAIHLVAALTFLGWLALTGDLRHALNVAIATLIITCPCALGLAIPAVSAAATGRLYRLGALVKSDTALERLAQVDTVVFDKTGTLTRAELSVPQDLPVSAREVLRALARASDHPLSKSLDRALAGVSAASLDAVRECAGQGVWAEFKGAPVSLAAGSDGSAELATGDILYRLDRSEVLVPGATEMVSRLEAQGLDVQLLTGDAEERAHRTGSALGISAVHARIPADRKSHLIEALKTEGRNVLMIGDGLNDAAALSAADVSIAPGHALDVSRSAADVVVTGGIATVDEVLAVSRAARRRMVENLCLAGAYNTIAVPLAVMGFATPLWAALAMSASSITVTLNAMRVR